jgi:hypothetical protein
MSFNFKDTNKMNINAFNRRLTKLQTERNKIYFNNLQNDEELKKFLPRVIDHLQSNPDDGEHIAHFLMGKRNDLPLSLVDKPNLSPQNKATLYDLLRTHRQTTGILGWFGKVEASEKTIAKLQELNTKLFGEVIEQTFTKTNLFYNKNIDIITGQQKQELLIGLNNARTNCYPNRNNTCLFDADFIKYALNSGDFLGRKYNLPPDLLPEEDTQIDNTYLQYEIQFNDNTDEKDSLDFVNYEKNSVFFSYANRYRLQNPIFVENSELFNTVNSKFSNGCFIRTGKSGPNAGHYVYYHPNIGIVGGLKDPYNFKPINEYYKNRYYGKDIVDVALFDISLHDFLILRDRFAYLD